MEISFKWCKETTRLIIEEYNNRKREFRDPKNKKKDLWIEIKNVFVSMGYNITWELLDRKFRNLKKTYTEIKDKHSGTGNGRINWEHYDVFDNIFADDRAINSNITIASISDESDLNGVCSIVEASTSLAGSSSRKRSLQDYRQQQLDIERAKFARMDRLIDNVERNTKVHQERNNLLKQIIDVNSPTSEDVFY